MAKKVPKKDDPNLVHVFYDNLRARRIRASQLVQWVRDGIEHAQLLLKERDDPTASNCTVFWLRLNGVFSDIERWAREKREERRKVHEADGYDPLFELIDTVVTHIEQLRAAFTDDELMWLEYMRHTEAHPTPHAFDHGIEKDGQVRTTYKAKALGRPVSLLEFDDAIERVYQALDNQKRSAVIFAERAIAPLSTLHFALRSWEEATRLTGEP